MTWPVAPARKLRAISISLWDGPLAGLVEHFARRLFAPEDEQDGGGLGLGTGAVLALLALPGAFASILLLEKYSSLLQFLRGHFTNAILSSPKDEYFFIVLSMTITGLVMVARWNRLLPDERDFSNLAVLPIAIRNIFLANLAALMSLALLFAVDVNCVSTILFPLFVTMDQGPMAAFLWMIVCHFCTVMSASLFSFFAVFALVGVLMLVTPRRVFRRVSLAARILLVVGLLTEFFSNLFLQLFATHAPGVAGNYMRLLPSFWFLGVYERMMGIASPAMAKMGGQALSALAGMVALSLGAYALCYRRYFLRLSESMHQLGTARRAHRRLFPEAWTRWLFRSPFEYACASFARKVLLRSEQHMMFFGAYLGVGVVLAADTALRPGALGGATEVPGVDYLTLPLILAFVILSGMRFAFDTPAVIAANWIFQASVGSPHPRPDQIARRLMLGATIPWEVGVVGPLAIHQFGWRIGLVHLATVAALTVFAADALLVRFRKIPFTCRTALDIRQLLGRLLGSVLTVLIAAPALAGLERWMLVDARRWTLMTILYGACWRLLRYYRKEAMVGESSLVFDDVPRPQFELMKLQQS